MTGIVIEKGTGLNHIDHSHPREFKTPAHYFDSMCAVNNRNMRRLNRELSAELGKLPAGDFAIITTGSDGRKENVGSEIDLTLLCPNVVFARCLKTLLYDAYRNGDLNNLPLRTSGFIDAKYTFGKELNQFRNSKISDSEGAYHDNEKFLGINPRMAAFGLCSTPSDFRELRSVRLIDACHVFGSQAVIKQAQHMMVEQLLSDPKMLESTLDSYRRQLTDNFKTLKSGCSNFKGKTLQHFEHKSDGTIVSYMDRDSVRSVKYAMLRVLQNRLSLDFLQCLKEEASGRQSPSADLLKFISSSDPNQLINHYDSMASNSNSHRLLDDIYSQSQAVVGRLSIASNFGYTDLSQTDISRLQMSISLDFGYITMHRLNIS